MPVRTKTTNLADNLNSALLASNLVSIDGEQKQKTPSCRSSTSAGDTPERSPRAISSRASSDDGRQLLGDLNGPRLSPGKARVDPTDAPSHGGDARAHRGPIALADTIRSTKAQTLVVRPLPFGTTVAGFVEAVNRMALGPLNFDYIHLPVHNSTCEIQGLACVNFATSEDAVRFCFAAWGMRFGDEVVTVNLAAKQGVLDNLDSLGANWSRRRKLTERSKELGYLDGHGLPHIKTGAGMGPIRSKDEFDAARAMYALVGAVRGCQASTLLVKSLPADTTMSCIDEMGQWNYDYLHLPVHNSTCEIQGLACVNFASTDEAVRFINSAWGMRINGEVVTVDLATRQGVVENLDHFCGKWSRRRKVADRAQEKGLPGHGLPFIRVCGAMHAMRTMEDINAARAIQLAAARAASIMCATVTTEPTEDQAMTAELERLRAEAQDLEDIICARRSVREQAAQEVNFYCL